MRSMSFQDRGFFNLPAAPCRDASVGYFGACTMIFPCCPSTKAILSCFLSPNCLRTTTGIVTWPLLEMVARISFCDDVGVKDCVIGKEILPASLLFVKRVSPLCFLRRDRKFSPRLP